MVDTARSGASLAATILIPGTFTLIIFLLRIWFRITRRKYDVSDTLLVAAVLCGLVQSVIWLVLVFPFHHGKLKAETPRRILASTWPSKLLYMNQIIFKLTTPLCKLSLCFLYRTICNTSTGRLINRTRIAIWSTIYLLIGVYLSALLVSVFQCTPIRKIWAPKVRGHCIDVTQFRYTTAAFNILTSLIVVTLPIPVLMKLKHHRPEVKQLIGLVLLGLIHTSLTIARFVVMFFPDPWIKTEPQYGWVPAQMLAVCEMDANILFATLVVMRPAFQAVYHALRPGYVRTGKSPDSSRGDSVIESALGRFRDAWERRMYGKSISETYVLETTIPKADTTIDIERGAEVARDEPVVEITYVTAGR
ncbi:hypothetical protein CC86DRAFT_461609 [Ophiobolus disseminans]|uniref:Rhodopsin domain-containing protein n=1 Tax=Ophiobolus disseminans TaxID=1469910 RepID=A0A6A7AIP3_9PLEO|nr:hypothetical protein CC86DRAFT_461609 [Ophiobolus disseminans]